MSHPVLMSFGYNDILLCLTKNGNHMHVFTHQPTEYCQH